MMGKLIGQSVQNVSEHHSVINVKVGVTNRIADFEDLLMK